jgi:hypothetical protein
MQETLQLAQKVIIRIGAMTICIAFSNVSTATSGANAPAFEAHISGGFFTRFRLSLKDRRLHTLQSRVYK